MFTAGMVYLGLCSHFGLPDRLDHTMSVLESAARILAYYAAVELIENKKYGDLGTYDANDTFWSLSDALAHLVVPSTHEPLVEMSDDRAREVISEVMRSTTDRAVWHRLAAILTVRVLNQELINEGPAYVIEHDGMGGSAFCDYCGGNVSSSIRVKYSDGTGWNACGQCCPPIRMVKPSKRHAPIRIYG